MRGRHLLAIAVLFHLVAFALKTSYNAYVIDGSWFFAPLREDVMISMRYANNLAEGYGLVWNVGERVEGYTNFLWTLILAIPHALHVPRRLAFLFPVGVNLVLYIFSLRILWAIAEHSFRSDIAKYLSTSIFSFFLIYAYWGTMGFETSLEVFLLLLALYGLSRYTIDGKSL